MYTSSFLSLLFLLWNLDKILPMGGDADGCSLGANLALHPTQHTFWKWTEFKIGRHFVNRDRFVNLEIS